MSISTEGSRMTAVVCHAPEDYRVETVKRPMAARNELVIRIAACGICARNSSRRFGSDSFAMRSSVIWR